MHSIHFVHVRSIQGFCSSHGEPPLPGTRRGQSTKTRASMGEDPAPGWHSTGVFHLLLLAAAKVAADGLVKLSTSDLEVAPCHHRVTLHCNISAAAPVLVETLDWLRANTGTPLCEVNNLEHLTEAPGVHCVYSQGQQLMLTFRHIRAADQGQYICKLRSNRGIKEASATVKLKECYRSVHHRSSSSATACSFSGVYPEGEVHFFDGDRNLTRDLLHHSVEPNRDGTFNVSGSIPAGGATGGHQCSLWMRTSGSYVAKHQVPVSSLSRSVPGSGTTTVEPVEVSLVLLLIGLLMV
ncbi:hypothetical protein GN956_G8304 [Arapaima gigas]